MKKIYLFLTLALATYSALQAQSKKLIINQDITMPEDSMETQVLLSTINAFLTDAQENQKNKWILPAEIVETQILIDEIQDIQKNKEREDDFFYQGYLTNIIPVNKNDYVVKISYIGEKEDSSFLRANFELVAHKSNDSYLISSPLRRNTQNWKSKKIHNHIFYYPYTLDDEIVQDFVTRTVFYDEKLENNIGETHYYLCKDELDPLKLFGVDYKSDYNGNDLNTSWVSSVDDKSLWILNENHIYDFDPHDLWHHRLSQVISRRKVNRSVDESISYLYGGSWGLSWNELFPIFRDTFVVDSDVDWLAHKNDSAYFMANEHRNYTDNFVGALIVKKIESENGFAGVWKLLNAKGLDNYFIALKELTGITKQTYNHEVSKLIEDEINNLGS